MNYEKYILKGETKLILVLVSIFTFLRVFNSIKMYSDKLHYEGTVDLSVFLSNRFLAWSVSVVFAIIIVKTTGQLLQLKQTWWQIVVLHILAAIGITFMWFASYILLNWITCLDGNCDSLEGFWTWYLNNFDNLLTMYLFAASFTYAWHYIRRANAQRLRNEEVERQLTTTRLRMLQSQLQPHFLFNTLNSITSLIGADDSKARDMIADLSDLLRNCLDNNSGQLIPLQEEMQLLEKYVDIEKTRFAEQLQIDIQVAPEVHHAAIPALLLQPLVENSIAHGFSRAHPTLAVHIELKQVGDNLSIEVSDNGKGLSNEEQHSIFERGTGLRNTRERLQTLYEDGYIFKVKNGEKGVINTIILPFISHSKSTNYA